MVNRNVASILRNIDVGDSMRYDAARFIDSICLSTYQGLPKPFKTAWLIDVAIHQGWNLGDGVITWDRQTNTWNPSQRKGKYEHTSHMLIRKPR